MIKSGEIETGVAPTSLLVSSINLGSLRFFYFNR